MKHLYYHPERLPMLNWFSYYKTIFFRIKLTSSALSVVVLAAELNMCGSFLSCIQPFFGTIVFGNIQLRATAFFYRDNYKTFQRGNFINGGYKTWNWEGQMSKEKEFWTTPTRSAGDQVDPCTIMLLSRMGQKKP